MAIITISRQYGAGGEQLARALAKELGLPLVDRKSIQKVLRDMNLPADLLPEDIPGSPSEDMEKRRRYMLTAIHDYLFDLAKTSAFVLLGQGGQYLFRERKDSLHILVHAAFDQRVQWIQEVRQLEKKQAGRLVREQDRKRKRYLKQFFNRPWMAVETYDLCLNTGRLTVPVATEVAFVTAKAFLKTIPEDPASSVTTDTYTATNPNVSFMHPSEAEFARILDFYKIAWEYEPRTFPLQWDEKGRVTEAFSPDFYLPEHQLYVELTTQRQKLVWRKNKKARRLRELYPDVQVKIVYNKDFRHLLESFGIQTD